MLNKMKPRYSGKRVLVLLIVVLLTTNYSSAQQNNQQTGINSSAKKNLVMAINSDNTGLKRSAVYFAGYYKINEAVDPLINLLNSSSTDISLKTLAAYSLHQIGDEECIDALKELSAYCSDKKLCSKCKFMYEDLVQVKSGVVQR
jgi:hypothetical protein